jgi:hypothetical protein
MRRFRDPGVLPAAALAALTLLAPRLDAGLRFEAVSGPNGGDVRSLAMDAGGTLWAGTYRGVWTGFFEWNVSGLTDRTVSAVAVAGGIPFAATGDAVWRLGSDGTWSAETIPGTDSARTVLVTDGTTLWAAGRTAARRSGGTWTALPAVPGTAISGTLAGTDLVLGLLSGGAVRFSGSAWVPLAAGIGASEGVAALLSDGTTLYAGTAQGLYAWSGSQWVQDSAFGRHTVQGLTSFGGTLRAATADAGVLARSGSSWTADNAGLLTTTARVFAASGGDLYLATGGGPVYRRVGSGWAVTPDAFTGPAARRTQLQASVVSDLVSATDVEAGPADLLVASRGAGVQSPLPQLPAGCGDVTAASRAPDGSVDPFLVATGCGVYSGGTSAWTATTAGFPSGVVPTTLAKTPFGTFAGTATAGLYRYNAGGWTVDSTPGLPVNSAVAALRFLGSSLWVATTDSLFSRTAALAFTDSSDGLAAPKAVTALAGSTPVFAAQSSGGVFRRDAATFRPDGAGILTAQLFSLDFAGGPDQASSKLFAAAGKVGPAVKRDGGWMPETSGLPVGADVRVVRGAITTLSRDPGVFAVRAGTAGNGPYVARAQSDVRTLPVVLDVVGGTGARFRSELTIGLTPKSIAGRTPGAYVTYVPAPGFGQGGGTAVLPSSGGREIRAADALAFLRGLGIPVPEASPGAPVAGSLSIFWADETGHRLPMDGDYVLARTYTTGAGGGTYGLFNDAPSDLEAAEEKATVYGLRRVSGSFRSNLALAHVPSPSRGSAPIQLSVQVYAANGTASGSPLTATLAPGEWTQFNDVLGLAGLPDGAYGYALVTRTAGAGPFTAYGVVNDMATSDGSYLPMFRPGGRAAARRQIVPVVLDLLGAAGSHYTTELTIANDGTIGTPVDLVYQPAPGFGSATGVPAVTVTLAAKEQRTIPDVIAFLRANGVNIPDPAVGGPQAGTLSVHFRFLDALDAPKSIVLARTSTPNPDASVGGAFGLFYPAVAKGGGARTSARVPALSQTASVRSNLAVVHTGGGSELPVTLSVQLYDAATGAAAGSALAVTLQPGDWYQWSRVLEVSGALAKTTAAYAVVTRVSGDDTFFAYGVLNDNVTSDGCFVAGIPAESY